MSWELIYTWLGGNCRLTMWFVRVKGRTGSESGWEQGLQSEQMRFGDCKIGPGTDWHPDQGEQTYAKLSCRCLTFSWPLDSFRTNKTWKATSGFVMFWNVCPYQITLKQKTTKKTSWIETIWNCWNGLKSNAEAKWQDRDRRNKINEKLKIIGAGTPVQHGNEAICKC